MRSLDYSSFVAKTRFLIPSETSWACLTGMRRQQPISNSTGIEGVYRDSLGLYTDYIGFIPGFYGDDIGNLYCKLQKGIPGIAKLDVEVESGDVNWRERESAVWDAS